MDFLYEKNASFETEKIYLSRYFQEFRLSLETVPNTVTITKKKRKKKNPNEHSLIGRKITPEEHKELAERCSISKLKVPGEPEQIPDVYLNGMWYLNETCAVPSGCNLRTPKFLNERKLSRNLPYSNRIFHTKPTPEDDLRSYDDIVAVVHVYEPFKYTDTRHGRGIFAEIQLLGKQTLADLRDRIICPKDLECPGDVSESAVAAQGKKGKDILPSSFIFIEDVFYNDKRTPGNIDYSSEIRTWAESQGVSLASLETKSMEKTKVTDLCLRFGRPYVFVHMGNCEHLIVFRTARLLHETDCLQSAKYPLYTSLFRRQCKTCMMCQKITAKWLVRECDRLVYDTTYLCITCFESFLYLSGNKVGDFKAYVYVDRASILA
ncbi:snRNA-activating protein complex subunit 3-like isoform X1 [Schistocerca piceifrons]|uniref:snRNA-activating protein complex subunit 3-like isoform X1 n=1 Tax=Schistocerca piceifrons TaxID=274613 RepID=UPI001F5F4E80|nr:snRNA-activating protein complex subunit 3-like isoform X1 [Schistocerca piceifrons]